MSSFVGFVRVLILRIKRLPTLTWNVTTFTQSNPATCATPVTHRTADCGVFFGQVCSELAQAFGLGIVSNQLRDEWCGFSVALDGCGYDTRPVMSGVDFSVALDGCGCGTRPVMSGVGFSEALDGCGCGTRPTARLTHQQYPEPLYYPTPPEPPHVLTPSLYTLTCVIAAVISLRPSTASTPSSRFASRA